jgi:poly-gamma-glutamate synthesis protein (capsule biosynthesis protein)
MSGADGRRLSWERRAGRLALRLAPIGLLLLAMGCAAAAEAPVIPTPLPTPQSTPAPATITVVVDDAPLSPALIEAAVGETAAALSLKAEIGGNNGPGAPGNLVQVSLAPKATFAASAPLRYWGAFTAFWSETETVALDSAAVHVYLPAGAEAALRELLGESLDRVRVTWVSPDQVIERVLAEPSAIGLLPFDSIDARVRGVRVFTDGMNEPLGTAAAPLVERLWVAWQDDALRPFGAALAARLAQPPPPLTRLVATGDIIPARCVYERQRDQDDFTAAFKPLAPFLSAADLTIGSLDAAISEAGEPEDCHETLSLLAPPETTAGFVHAGLDLMAVAANHIKDCGTRGFCGDESFVDTLENLRAAGVRPVGGGLNRAEAHAPVVVTVNGVRFAFLAYDDVSPGFTGAGEASAGVATFLEDRWREDVARAHQLADVVIVSPQWGVEYTPDPSSRQRDLAGQLVAAGVDLVIGNHPHSVAAVEWREDAFVAYALGNFVYDQNWSVETEQGLLLEATFWGSRLVEVRLLPTRIVDMYQPNWAAPEDARAILDRVRTASEALTDAP